MKNKVFNFGLVLIIGTLFTSIYSCAQKVKNLEMPDTFYACWKAANEEYDAKTKIQVYRSCDHKFGPSMFRHYMTFKKDGSASYLQPSPTDAHDEVEGTWAVTKKDEPVTILNNKNEPILKFTIILLEKDLMRIIAL